MPEIPRENPIISSLLSIRKFILRIVVFYDHEATTQRFFASGCLLTNQVVLTCAHTFDPIRWEDEVVPYSKISVSFSDPAEKTLFSSMNPDNSLIDAKIIQRGLGKDNLSKFTELKYDSTDLALLLLDKPAPHLQVDEFFDPQLNLSSSSKSNPLPINAKLFLIGYNGPLTKHEDLNPYKYLPGFQHITVDKLNLYHHVNYKSISIGHLIKEACENDPYSLHNCSTLPGTGGSIILDCYGKLAGIHIGISNSRKEKNHDIFFTKETYNKFVSINSNQFQAFIRETILPNIKHDESVKKWLFDSK